MSGSLGWRIRGLRSDQIVSNRHRGGGWVLVRSGVAVQNRSVVFQENVPDGVNVGVKGAFMRNFDHVAIVVRGCPSIFACLFLGVLDVTSGDSLNACSLQTLIIPSFLKVRIRRIDGPLGGW